MANGIAQARNKKVLLKRGGNTRDIVDAILDVVPDVRNQTAGFARQFTPDRRGMRSLFDWVKGNIRYIEDPLGVQWIREPARLWHDREGDCKSFTVFIISVLENLGLKYIVRFSNTDRAGSKIVNHVYPVAIMPDGRQIIMDAVHGYFDDEHPYYYKLDYDMADIYRLSGIGTTAPADLEKYADDLDRLTADIPDDVLDNDITEMTKGDFNRFLQYENFSAQASAATDAGTQARYAAAADAVRSGTISGISGISGDDARKISAFLAKTSKETGKAFQAPVLLLPDGITGVGSLKDVVNKVVDAVKSAWKKIINWIFKSAMPLAAPFFLYAFLKKKIGKKTAAKQDKATKLVRWIQTTGKFDSADAVLASARSGIIKKLGKTPEALLNEAAKGKAIAGADGIGVLPALAPLIAKILPVVIDIVQKIAKLFKKSEPEVSSADQPNFDELSYEFQQDEAAAAAAAGGGKSGTTAGAATGGIPMPLILAGAGLAALLILKK